MTQGRLFGDVMTGADVAETLRDQHYLGPSRRTKCRFVDDAGIMEFGPPASRRLPRDWLELQRWCITDKTKNAGSAAWARAVVWLRDLGEATTVVSYSDPSVGHTGALYRASNWLWAPTWHVLVPPPTGLGSWKDGKVAAVKHRWIFPLLRDPRRATVLHLEDSYERRFPGAGYREPRWVRHDRPDLRSGGGDFKAWVARKAVVAS